MSLQTAISVVHLLYASPSALFSCMHQSPKPPLAGTDQLTPAPEDLLKAVVEAVQDLTLRKVHTAVIKAECSHHDDIQ